MILTITKDMQYTSFVLGRMRQLDYSPVGPPFGPRSKWSLLSEVVQHLSKYDGHAHLSAVLLSLSGDFAPESVNDVMAILRLYADNDEQRFDNLCSMLRMNGCKSEWASSISSLFTDEEKKAAVIDMFNSTRTLYSWAEYFNMKNSKGMEANDCVSIEELDQDLKNGVDPTSVLRVMIYNEKEHTLRLSKPTSFPDVVKEFVMWMKYTREFRLRLPGWLLDNSRVSVFPITGSDRTSVIWQGKDDSGHFGFLYKNKVLSS
jgi:hypothetical protein